VCTYALSQLAASSGVRTDAGVPAPAVAERAGHAVDVVLRFYAECIDGREATVNARIEGARDDQPRSRSMHE
jgi:hypothetical protein